MNATVTTPAGGPGTPALSKQARTWWLSRTPRERQLVTLVGIVLVVFVVWSLMVQPALKVLREAPARIDRLDLQLQQMQGVAAESRALRDGPRVSTTQAVQALRAATDRLGEQGRLVVQGGRATLTLTSVTPDALRAWLAEARSGARVRPVEAQLQRGPSGYSGTLGVLIGGAP